jgi:hypothetical protein
VLDIESVLRPLAGGTDGIHTNIRSEGVELLVEREGHGAVLSSRWGDGDRGVVVGAVHRAVLEVLMGGTGRSSSTTLNKEHTCLVGSVGGEVNVADSGVSTAR